MRCHKSIWVSTYRVKTAKNPSFQSYGPKNAIFIYTNSGTVVFR